MTSRWKPFSSSVVEKYLIAATGLGLVLYLVVHLAGNLLVFLGPDAFNEYAHVLISNPLVVPVEIGLLAIFLVHVYKTTVMWWRNRAARPEGYYRKRWAGRRSRKSWASTTMIYTGVVTAVFVVLHVWSFKYGTYYLVADTEVRDLHRLVIEFFQSPLNVVFYEACLVLLGFHVWHGFASAFESLGADRPGFTPKVLAAGKVLAVVLGGGFVAIPLWVYFFGGRV
ncbi:MAG TPA: succinate dehydrogenase cytochrome b subunit [Vicinamibacterales bacterium]|nr:succinate dehydrogenase cytochrome b subunit [Vicinamibacterales bacterium]